MSDAHALWQVAAQGHFQEKLGRRRFSLDEATAIADDLRTRGYADAHAQLWTPDSRRPRPPFPLTLCVARRPTGMRGRP